MSLTDELEAYLKRLNQDEFVHLAKSLKLRRSENMAFEVWRQRMTDGILASRYNKPAFFDRVVRFCGVKDPQQKELELADEANRLAGEANEIAETASHTANRAVRLSLISLVLAAISAFAAVATAIISGTK